MTHLDIEKEREAFAAAYIAEFGELKSISRERAIELAWCSGAGRMWLAARRASLQADEGKDAELEAARELIAAFESMLTGCTIKSFAGYENGNGTNVGKTIEAKRKKHAAITAKEGK